ncbi:GLPGLI family protein [Chitinophaga dinghuensis]|uniref:GLPGLI family protein n=1 Tax=Chitinophaga dinghuensis TaxID=1539050 RepID=A0A327W4K9_9BACT|nr:GLPGLI family protein [Chitinophaga dinghuensis]RAJ85437.1 GLPGLI family protein [Chitinophaga dinghuensis]
MNLLSRLVLAAALLPLSSSLFAQQSGVIDYEVTQRIDRERMARFQGNNNDNSADIPDVVTLQQHFTFNNGIGKLTTDRPDFGGNGGFGGGRRNGQRGDSATQQGQRRQGGGPGQGGGFRGGMGNQLVDLQHKKYQNVFSTSGDDRKTYFTEEDFIIASNVQNTDKTKKIAGYTCKKATVKLKDDTYTIWYTTELPFAYSPINGLLPDSNAVILSAEGGNRSFTAQKVTLKPVTDTDLALPADAQKISQDQMRDLRRDEMEKLRKRQQQN